MPKPRPRPEARPRPPKVVRAPHDAYRLGLPLAALAPTEGATRETALLLAAGLLLTAAAAGSLTVGLTVRKIAGGA